MPGCSPDHTRTLIMQSVLKLKDSTRVSTHVILDISFDVYLNEGDVSGCSDKKILIFFFLFIKQRVAWKLFYFLIYKYLNKI